MPWPWTFFGRIKRGATVMMDHAVWTWPDLPHASEDMTFEFTGVASDGGAVQGRAPYFGGVQGRAPYFGGEPYGNGSVYVYTSDYIWKQSDKSVHNTGTIPE